MPRTDFNSGRANLGLRSYFSRAAKVTAPKSASISLHSPALRIIPSSANPPGLCRKACSLSAGLLFCVARLREQGATL